MVLLLGISLGLGGIPAIWGQSQPEAGFCDLEANNFYFHLNSYFNRIVLRSSPAWIWRCYQPAKENPASQPLFVFFNGGPGGATSAGLFSANTSRLSVKVDEATGKGSLVDNPSAWTRIGNLLYIDARTTGFSYSLMDNPQDDALRKAEFNAQNYNSFTDGADFVRVLLRFLAEHPQIQGNRVILVPESYGGIRTIVMLHLLLYYQDYGNGRAFYQDPELVREIQNHYDTVFPEYRGQTVPPAVIARQFGHQIMIQVALTRSYQRQIAVEMLEAPGSFLYKLALETGVPYIPLQDQPGAGGNPTPSQIMNNIYDYLDRINRDPYIYSKPDGFFWGFFAVSTELLSHFSSLNRMTGINVGRITEMYASARQQAYKLRLTTDASQSAECSALIGPPPQEKQLTSGPSSPADGDLSAVFGVLQPWDTFFIDLNYAVSRAFSINNVDSSGFGIYYGRSHRYGRMFLETVAWVHTFITNAAYDIVVYSPSIPRALGLHDDILSGSFHDRIGPPGAERPGQIILDYRPGSVPGSDVVQRTIRFPYYSQSGHAVTLTEPARMLQDVIAWLRTTGMTVNDGKGEDQ